jgi:hypothetical protein
MSQQLDFTDAEWSALEAEFCKGFTKEQADVCRAFCRVRNLIPGKHVLFQLRRSNEWDEVVNAKVKVTKIVFITTIDAARLIALRSGEYTGQDQETYIYLDENGSPSIESHVPLPQLPLPPAGQTALPREPWAVRTTVYRKSFDHPITSIARFDAYASTYKTEQGPQLTEMWQKRGPEQLAKCSEMLSLRKSFPEELGSLLIALELKNENEEVPASPPSAVVPPPPVPVVPKVDNTPAPGTQSPRPGEVKAIEVDVHYDVKPALPPSEEFEKSKAEVERRAGDEKLKAALAAVPDLKKASELPQPAPVPPPAEPAKQPAKRGRKPKENSPVNGPVPGEITDGDIARAQTPQPPPEITPEAARQEAEKFVESLDPTPTKEEMGGFSARTRDLAKLGAQLPDLKNYILNYAKKSDTKQLTVGNWKQALDQLEQAHKDGKLVEVTKNAPLPQF